MLIVSVAASYELIAHSAVPSASAAARATVCRSSSRSRVEEMARLASTSARSRRFCCASRRNMRALWIATAAGTASCASSRCSSAVKRRGCALLDQREEPEHLVVEDQGDREVGLLAPLLHLRQVSGVERRVVDLELAYPARLDHVAVRRAVGDVQDEADPLAVGGADLARPQRGGDDRAVQRSILVNVALPDVEQLRQPLGDGREDFVGLETRRHGGAHFESELEPLVRVAHARHAASLRRELHDSYTSVRFLPARLAAYSALSAFVTRSSARRSPWSSDATPTLTVSRA